MDGREVALLLAVGGTATVGQFFLTKAFAAGPPAKVSVVALTQVAFALAFDVILWQQSFHSSTLLGMVLVIAPTAWVLGHRPTLEAGGDALAVGSRLNDDDGFAGCASGE
jgi:drug/metabolite transporter (DMT)-like permease